MPAKRKRINIGLPRGWSILHNAYYYKVPQEFSDRWNNKKFFRLGKSLTEAYKAWSDRMLAFENAKTIGQVLDRYIAEVVPQKDVSSQATQLIQIKQLQSVFSKTILTDLKPMHVYQYVDKRKVKYRDENGRLRGGMTAAEREVEILSHAYTKAVEWGYIDRHPFKGEMRVTGSNKPRDRYVEDWEIRECMKLTSPLKKSNSISIIQAYIQLKIITGMDRGDLLRLTDDDLKEDGIHNTRGKTEHSSGKKTIYRWSPTLIAAVDAAKAAKPCDSKWLFCTNHGGCFYNEENGRADGWKNNWQRFMKRLLEETEVKESFTEHDLRAKAASDADTLEQAQGLLAHADPNTTKRIYRRKAEVVNPLNGVQ